VRDAARGVGMTARQRLLQVELPLALPAILTGIRIVLVQNIGLAVIAGLVGGGGLGVFVFQGISQNAGDLVLLGALPTVAMATGAAVLLDAVVDLSRGRAAERVP
jgi:osmoprotectant transport system permease protein